MERPDDYDSGALKQEFIDSLDSTLQSLTSIWNEVGIFDEVRNARKAVVILHLKNLLEVMVREEETMKAELYTSIEKFKRDISRLCKEFQLPEFKPADGLTILQLEKEYRVRVDSLNKERSERMTRLKELSATDQRLCDELCETPFYIPTGTVPTSEQLSQLNEHIVKLQQDKENRQKEFKQIKRSIQRYMSELELSPNTSFERDVVADDDECFMLTQENMKSLRAYHERLIARQKENVATADRLRTELDKLWLRLDEPQQHCTEFIAKYSDYAPKTLQALREELVRCKLAKIQNIRRFTDLARNDIRMWWDKCFYTAEQRAAFKPLTSEEFSEEMLDRHEEEVRLLENYYEENREFFEKVQRREKLWNDYLELERKAGDPNRLFLNRGCNLLKEEKQRNAIMKELPKVEHEVEEEVLRWEKQTGNVFTMCGKRYPEYIKNQVETYKIQKEAEKLQRQQQRARKVEEEMKFGSKPVSATVKRIHGTPSKCSSIKQRRVSPTPTGRFDSAAILTPSSKVNKAMATVAPLENRTPMESKAVASVAPLEKNGFFSETTVSSGEIQLCDPEATIAAVVHYQDFAAAMNENIRTNCRSSVLPPLQEDKRNSD